MLSRSRVYCKLAGEEAKVAKEVAFKRDSHGASSQLLIRDLHLEDPLECNAC